MNARSDDTDLTVAQRLFVGLQYFLPQIWLTRAIGWLAERRETWLKNAIIRGFARAYSVNLSEAASADPADYPNFNAFFTRSLKPDARTVDARENTIVAPCDGRISAIGRLDGEHLLQAKGFNYTAAELVGDPALAERFRDGVFMTIYLAPYDYHRVHTPVGASVTGHRHLPGQLFSVNGATAAAVPRLFARNERRVFTLKGEIDSALVMVGALNVGSISTPWAGTVIAGAHDTATAVALPEKPLARGEVIGWFNMGSTVILLMPSNADWDDELQPGDVLRMGEPIGRVR